MFGIFKSRPKDHLVLGATQTNVNALINNISLTHSIKELTINEGNIYLLQEDFPSNKIEEIIMPSFYSSAGTIKEFSFFINSSIADLKFFVGNTEKNSHDNSLKIKYAVIKASANIIQQYDKIARYKWRGWLGKAVTGEKKFSHYDNVARGLRGDEVNLIQNKLFEEGEYRLSTVEYEIRI